jgi:hypothetical protein
MTGIESEVSFGVFDGDTIFGDMFDISFHVFDFPRIIGGVCDGSKESGVIGVII